MKKRRVSVGKSLFLLLTVLLTIGGWRLWKNAFGEPPEVRELRSQETVQSEEGHQEYYFSLLDEDEQKGYRDILNGVRSLKEKFYLSLSGDEQIDRVYHAVLKDHPELFWIHNKEKVYKTTYPGKDYCQFSPGYSYTEEQREEIALAMEQAYQSVLAQIPEGADDYEKVKTVYTYLIDHTEYVISEDDQSIAGTFWKNQAVCAGYAGGMQYLLERLGVFCIYVEGDAKNSTQGHAWNIVRLDEQYYYVDVTNGDQPDFLEGDAVQLAEHKTTIYDYLCPFPWEYEENYTASEEFAVPECTASDKNFYVMNGACFEEYDRELVYGLCRLRIENNAAVIRFKFRTQEAYEEAYLDLVENGAIQQMARYYLKIHGLSQVSYHYGVLENMKTMYYMF